jgi:hypothetical protein
LENNDVGPKDDESLEKGRVLVQLSEGNERHEVVVCQAAVVVQPNTTACNKIIHSSIVHVYHSDFINICAAFELVMSMFQTQVKNAIVQLASAFFPSY